MALHVTQSEYLWNDVTLIVDDAASGILAVDGFIEGRFYIKADVEAGTWTPKVQVQDPRTGTWIDRSDSFTAMTPTGGPESDGLNQTQTVSMIYLGGRLRMVLNVTGAASPSITITAVFEGKT